MKSGLKTSSRTACFGGILLDFVSAKMQCESSTQGALWGRDSGKFSPWRLFEREHFELVGFGARNPIGGQRNRIVEAVNRAA